MLLELDLAPTQVEAASPGNIFCAAGGRMQELLTDLNSVARGNKVVAELCDIREIIAAASDAASAITKKHNVEILLRNI